MPRTRTIKPKLPQSKSLGRVSRDARLLFVLLLTQADDEGRLHGAPLLLAGTLFPYDDDARDLIDGWLDELEREGCVRRYVIDGEQYIDIPKWLEYQRISHPTPSRLPPFPDTFRTSAKSLERQQISSPCAEIPEFRCDSGINPESIRSDSGIRHSDKSLNGQQISSSCAQIPEFRIDSGINPESIRIDAGLSSDFRQSAKSLNGQQISSTCAPIPESFRIDSGIIPESLRRDSGIIPETSSRQSAKSLKRQEISNTCAEIPEFRNRPRPRPRPRARARDSRTQNLDILPHLVRTQSPDTPSPSYDTTVPRVVRTPSLDIPSPSYDTTVPQISSPVGELVDKPPDGGLVDARHSRADIVRAMIEIWNRVCGDVLPRARVVSKARAQSLAARLSEIGDDITQWEALCRRVRASRFLTGQKSRNDREPFVATLDWVIAPRNFVKIAEGNYDDRKSEQRETIAQRAERLAREHAERHRHC